MRIAATLLLTSLGPVVIHGGTEIARSKGLAPLPDAIGGELRLDAMPLAPIYIKGRGDTYNLRAANAFRWETIGNTDGAVDHAAMLDWWRGLIALRASPAGDVFRVGEEVPEGWVREVPSDSPHALGYVVGGRVMVLLNTGDVPASFQSGEVSDWRLVASADAEGGRVDAGGDAVDALRPEATTKPVPSKGVRIWVRR